MNNENETKRESNTNKFDEIEIFEYFGNFYYIPRDKYELREIYLERVWFILNKLNEGKEMTTLIRESRIYSAQRLYGCVY